MRIVHTYTQYIRSNVSGAVSGAWSGTSATLDYPGTRGYCLPPV